MGYAETLSKMIEDSGLSLRKIAEECAKKGHPIVPSYISKLQSGKQGPASEEISKVIAEVCGGDPDELIWEGYMEKAPKLIKDFINTVLGTFYHITKQQLKFNTESPEYCKIICDTIDNMSAVEFIKLINEIIPTMSAPDEATAIKITNGEFPIKIDEKIGIPMPDDSMHPTIPKYSIINLIPAINNYDDGSIVVAEINKITYIRRIYIDDNNFLFISDNPSYKPLAVGKKDVNIFGLVKSYSVSLSSRI